jgi:hypothetical protein
VHELHYATVVVAVPLEMAARDARTTHGRHRDDLNRSTTATDSQWTRLLRSSLRLTARAGPAPSAPVDAVSTSVEAPEAARAA